MRILPILFSSALLAPLAFAQALAQLEAEHRLPGTNRAADADTWRTGHGEVTSDE